MSWLKSKLLNWLASEYADTLKQIEWLSNPANFPDYNDPAWNTADYKHAIKNLGLIYKVAKK